MKIFFISHSFGSFASLISSHNIPLIIYVTSNYSSNPHSLPFLALPLFLKVS